VSMNYSETSALRRVRTIADYQFGAGAGSALFPEECEFRLSRTKRIRYVLLGGDRLATVRAGDGRLTLSYAGALRLKAALEPPVFRVVIDDAVVEFVEKGKNAMAKHVIAADPGIRAGDEVLVVTPADDLAATGSAALSGEEMLAFNYGVAVNVRKGRDTS
jgi:uncharacterized protein with predicted RNA binding PUA domain